MTRKFLYGFTLNVWLKYLPSTIYLYRLVTHEKCNITILSSVTRKLKSSYMYDKTDKTRRELKRITYHTRDGGYVYDRRNRI